LHGEEPTYPGPRPVYPRESELARSARIAVIGDVQRTSFLECCLLGREVNDVEQRALLDDLATQAPDGVVLLGDMAFHASVSDWQHFDHLMAPLRRRASSVFIPVLGNHDYWGGSARVKSEVGGRFPGLLERTHYSVAWGRVRLIVLDGNREHLCQSGSCDAEWHGQLAWLSGQLRQVDESSRERAAILFVHQSPFTQSPWVQADRAGAREFASVLMDSNRGLAMISAHAHGFERYRFVRDPADRRAPKHFIVSAGGGGPRPREREPGAWPDESLLPWPRPFNYLTLTQDTAGVRVTVRALTRDRHIVQEVEHEGVELAFQP